MNIDERIEALTHSVELLSQMHQDNEKTYATLFNQLAKIAESHEAPIRNLEDRDDKR
ncbi:MAG TPA: hypothetical protein VG168_03005 [Bryobacteraceae bacterium]|jgi:hypothetical protein|nr:hypothetical protein [Bryobacteraceae bacterium]